ncbi:MAG: hypothetical protein L0177_06775 [Chloroflexi bacterium]|nr:hypothetical protein [Chloroflexota bacterium]
MTNRATNKGKVSRILRNITESGRVAEILEAVGKRLGIFDAMSELGPVTPEELAERAGVSKQYARRWLEARASGGYLDYDAATDRFSLWCPWPRTEQWAYHMAV